MFFSGAGVTGRRWLPGTRRGQSPVIRQGGRGRSRVPRLCGPPGPARASLQGERLVGTKLVSVDGRLDGDPAEWSHWRDLMHHSSRCPEGRRAGAWALEVLEEELGRDWLSRMLQVEHDVIPEVKMAWFHGPAFVDLVAMALALARCRNVPGYAKVRDAMSNDLRDDVRFHGLLQLEVASVGLAGGHAAVFEEWRRPSAAPVDVVVRIDVAELAVETRVVFIDQSMRVGRELSDRLSDAMHRLSFGYGVQFAGCEKPMGSISDALTANDVEGILSSIEKAAALAKEEHRPVTVEHQLVDLRCLPMSSAESGMGYEMPAGTGRGLDRTALILQDKAGQMGKSGARWLRIDLLDGTFGFSTWSRLRFPTRVGAIAAFVTDALKDAPHVRGAVVSSGALPCYGFLDEQSTRNGSTFGLRRRVDVYRGRETVIVPFLEGASSEGEAWCGLYDAEPGAMTIALADFDLPPLEVLTQVGEVVT